MKAFFFSLFALLAMPTLYCQTDIYMKYNQHTDEFRMLGKTTPAKDEVVEMWITPQKGRFNTGEEVSAILLAEQQLMYIIDHKKKKYTELDLQTLGLAGEDEETKEARKAMSSLGLVSLKAEVTETGETKTINGWNCKKYLLTTSMGFSKSSSEIWASEDLKMDYENYLRLYQANMIQLQGFEEFMKELRKIKGVQVMSTTSSQIMGKPVNSIQELKEFKQISAPAEVFELPEGYKKTKG